MLGASGAGAGTLTCRPASVAAAAVDFPKIARRVSFCSQCGKFSMRLVTPSGTEEDEHIVKDLRQVAQVARHRAVHEGLGVVEVLLGQEGGQLLGAEVRARQQELVLRFRFPQNGLKVVHGRRAHEDLALAVVDELLEVVGDRLRDAEVPHVLRHRDPHLLRDPEEVVDRVAAREDDRGVLLDVGALLAELLRREALDLDEGPPVDLEAVLTLEVEVRAALGLLLGD